MTYRYRHSSGQTIEREFGFADRKPDRIRYRGRVYAFDCMLAPGITIPVHHRAVTYAGAKGNENYQRHARVNAEVAKGLADGTMEPPKDREVFGEEMPREAKVDFNERYRAFREKAKKSG